MDVQVAEPDVKELVADEKLTEEAIEPPYKVIIHNDDVTPMEFVVMVLETIFQLPRSIAEFVMLTAHIKGIALVAVLPKSEAEKKVGKANFAANLEGFPLTLTLEPEA